MFLEQAKVFDSDSASTNDVIDAGEKALLLIYSGKLPDNLDSLRHKYFCEKVASKTSYVKLQSLLPTSAAAKYHSLRVYFQVQEWKGSTVELHPKDWVWQKCEEGFVAIQTSLPPAPEHLIRVIRLTAKLIVLL